MNNEQFLPFPEIPEGTFPGEERQEKITEETSTLLDETVIQSSSLVQRYREAKSISGKNLVLKQAVTFSEENFPTNATVLQTQLKNQIKHCENRSPQSSISLSPYIEMSTALTQEFEPPSNVKFFFQFQAHAIRNSEQNSEVKTHLKEKLLETFTKDGKNIFFAELGNKPKELDVIHKNAQSKYTSQSDIRLYLEYYIAYKQEPDFPISSLRHVVDNTNNEHSKYNFLVTDLLDELQDEGYNIEVIFEDSSLIKPEYHLYQLERDISYQEFKNAYQKRSRREVLRDITVIKQLHELANQAQETGEQTNIFVLRGSAHAPMTSLLPHKLKAISEEDNRGVVPREGGQGTFDQNNYDMLLKLRTDEEISEEEWKNLYRSSGRKLE